MTIDIYSEELGMLKLDSAVESTDRIKITNALVLPDLFNCNEVRKGEEKLWHNFQAEQSSLTK